ncbi:MAG: membrane dipeptidase [Clostridia bacterium]|nr:membrane dipeptidase [Clostridia bacterium]
MEYFDLHCDTLCRCLDECSSLYSNTFSLDLKRLKQFDTPVQTFAAFIHDKYKGSDATNRFYQLYEIYKNTDFGGITPVLSIENASALNGDIDNLHIFKELGVRIIALVWNGENQLAGGVDSEKGISEFGKSVIREMESLDIIVDVSHLNEKGFYQLCEIATKPFIASHSNSKSVCDHKRNLSDNQFKIIRDNAGLVGINLYPLFLGKRSGGYDDIFKHIHHFLEIGGEDVLSLGTDFDGADMDDRFKSVLDMQNLYCEIEKEFSKHIAEKIYFKNANKFFQIF